MTLVGGAALLGLGFLIGCFGTLIGAGGGFLLVPLLLLGYHFSPPTAVGTSLALVFLNAASGSVAYLRQRRVDLGLGWKFAAATVPGAIGGAYLTRTLSSSVFSLVFGVVLLIIAGLLFWGKTATPSRRATLRRVVDTAGESHTYHVDAWKGVLVSFVVGLMSSVLGIGGGGIHPPVLVVGPRLPPPLAAAPPPFFVSLSAFVRRATLLGPRRPVLLTTALMGAGILVGAQVGARVSLKAGATTIRIILAAALSLVGIRMILHAVQMMR